MVAALRVGKERFAAIGDPFHRSLQLACRPGHERFLGINNLLATKAPADIGCHHPQLALGNAEDQHPDQHAGDMWKLGRGIERVVAGRRFEFGQGRPRFHRVWHQPVIDEIDLGDVMGLGERGVGCRRITHRPIAAKIARYIFVELRCTGCRGRDDPRRYWQDAVVDRNAFGGASGGIDALGDDHRHWVADVAHLALRQQRVRWLAHWFAVPSNDPPGARHAVELVGGDVLGGEDRRDAGSRQRLGLSDCHDLRMGMGRAQEHRM